MGEWIGASIRFGGKIVAELVPELVDLIKAHGLSVDFEGDDPGPTNLHETFGDWQINYGCLDEFEAFAVRHGLDYEYWFDRGPDWDVLRDRVERNFAEFIARVPAAALADSGLKRHYKVPEPRQTLRRLVPASQPSLDALAKA